MSKIEDLLNRTVREEKNVTKGSPSLSIKVYIVIICSVIISICIFFGLYCVADVDTYLKDNKEIINLYDFYDQKVGENETAVYIIGSSVVAESIIPPEINSLLAQKGYDNIKFYTCSLSGDTPITRSVQLQNIIDSKPSLIIYGLMPRDIGADDWRDEYFGLVHDRLRLMNDSDYLYSAYQAKSFNKHEGIWYNKKFIQNALKYRYFAENKPHSTLNYSYDPLGEEYREYISSKGSDQSATIADVNNPKSRWRSESEVGDEWTQNKEALMYIVKKFKENDVPVIIVNMPINPLLSERISNSSYSNYFDLINGTNVTHYDLDGFGSPDDFMDSVHMNYDGALKFAPRMADLIIEQVEKDVIHYT